MNNKRSPFEQLLLIALLTFGAFTLYNQFYGPKKTSGAPPRTAPTLSQAFEGLDPATGKLPSEKAATTQIAELQKKIEVNKSDDYAMWAHLRVGLLQQYVLRNSIQARDSYGLIINRHQNKPIDAQALYQKGDLLWREAERGQAQGASTPLNATQADALKSEAVYALEQVPTRARGDRKFLDTKIFVPDAASHRTGDPLDLPQKWEQLSLTELRGESQVAGGRGILSRVDQYYKPTPLYKIFDAVVGWFGGVKNHTFSYGLALIVLALVTRTLMQPLIKKQYDSMKGMSVIAPEMKKIQDKYKGKTDQAAQVKMMGEIRALQKAHGVNPMGCGLSLLIQMPVFFFFVLPLINHYQARLELDNAGFGWIESLARPDIPLLALYAVSMFISVRLSATPPTDEQQKQMQKMTTLMSPLFALFLWSYPSAFILYWIFYNILSMIFQWKMIKKSEPNKDLVKTLMGVTPEGVVVSTPATAALPARPTNNKVSGKSKGGKTQVLPLESATPFEPLNGDLNGNSTNGAAKNGTSKSGAAAGSQRARRRRR